MSDLEKAAKELLDAVSFDVNGRMIGHTYQGGNGGLISIETLKAADNLRRVLSSLTRGSDV